VGFALPACSRNVRLTKLTIPNPVKDVAKILGLGILADAIWDGLKALSDVHLSTEIRHECFQLTYFIIVAAVGVLIEKRTSSKTVDRLRQDVEAAEDQQHINDLEELSDQGHFWVYYAHEITPLWRDGVGKWAQRTSEQLRRYYGNVKEQTFNTFDGMDKQTVDGIDLRYLNWRLKNLREIIQNLSGVSRKPGTLASIADRAQDSSGAAHP
jgi:hypothetical protein